MNQGASSGLTQADLAAFERIGVGPLLLDAAGVRRVTDGAARAEYGIQSPVNSDLSGIIFPYLDPASGERRTARLRRDHPELNAAGKPQRKYLCPFGDARHLYFPPGAGAMLANADCPVAIAEAEKSALAIAALAGRSGREMLAIATGGCWGWRGQTGIEPDASGTRVPVKGVLADFDRIAWHGRDAIICFDSNAASNPRVQAARRALAEELGARGARVRIAEIPPLDGVNGPDDLIAQAGDAALLGILDAARPAAAADMAAPDAEAAVAALERDQNAADLNACVKLIAALPDPAQAEILAGRAAKALRINKQTVLGTLRVERKNIENTRRSAAENARRKRLLRMAVIPAELISDLERFFSERAYLPPHVAIALALWAINTWVFDVFDTTPYLLLDSPVPQCGKTTVLRLLEAVAREPRQATAATEAALFRLVEANQPTLFVDEAEMLAGKGERAEAVRTIANAGYKRGASVPRCTGEAANIAVKDFPVYCPKAFAAIGGLRGALLDRCIVVLMARRPDGTTLKPVKEKSLRRDAEPIRERLEAYALQAREALAASYDGEPDGGYWPVLADREAELWEPLLHHARLAGIDTETRALAAAEFLSARKQQIQSEDQRFALAADLLDALADWKGATFAPGDLVAALENTETWGPRLAEKHEAKAKAACVGQFIRTLRLPSRQRTRTGTQYNAAEATERLRTLSPGKTATSATPATRPEKPTISGVADAQGKSPFRSDGSAGHFGNAVSDMSAIVAPETKRSAVLESRANGGAVAGVADVADNSGPGSAYWGEV